MKKFSKNKSFNNFYFLEKKRRKNVQNIFTQKNSETEIKKTHNQQPNVIHDNIVILKKIFNKHEKTINSSKKTEPPLH